MAQKREKVETNLELKVPADSPLSSLPSSCPDKNCKVSGTPPTCAGSTGPDPIRIDLGGGPMRKAKRRHRSVELPEAEASTRTDSSVEEAEEEAVPAKKKAVNRCSGCGKRVGLTGFRCRCGDLFCSEHRYTDRHDCSFDYKAAGREAIARENPVIRAPKILKV